MPLGRLIIKKIVPVNTAKDTNEIYSTTKVPEALLKQPLQSSIKD